MDMDLSETFKMFDTDGDGTVDLKEAKQAKYGDGGLVAWWPDGLGKPWVFLGYLQVATLAITSQFIDVQY